MSQRARRDSEAFRCVVLALVWLLGALCFNAGTAAAEEPNPEQRAFFEEKIRPVLVKHCYACHSTEASEVGGKLRMDSREKMRAGGESGPPFVAGKPNESLVIKALRYDGLEMPPDAPLPEAVIADFVKWVEMGAPDPRREDPPAEAAAPAAEAEDDKTLWSLRPITNPTPPPVSNADWCYAPLDQFVLAKLEAAALAPTGDAPADVLARRLSYDLVGLPPTFEQLEAFRADYQQHGRAAVERYVDGLLTSPHFGERWGRHWLDLAGYAESNGNDGLSRNPSFPHAWRYRDYVIQALNEDTPYDRFLTEQIAGDLLPAATPAERDRHLIATGFLAVSAKTAKAMNTNFEMDVVDNKIDVVGTAILGLSVSCARCHDHKHDPIPTKDYYALAGIFLSTETLWGGAAFDPLTADVTPLHKLETATPTPAPPADLELNDGAKAEIERTKGQLAKHFPLGTAYAMGVRDKPKPADCKINIKGESKQLGPVVPRGFLSACTTAVTPAIDPKQSGRLQLAEWLMQPDHPLTARVMANRVWLHLFGEGIVRTPDDFGVYGEPPTHPELLDHLATEFRTQGWSLKKLIRTIVLSRTYQLSSQADAKSLAADPDNRLVGRHQRRRLDAESLRDSLLMASGELDLQPAVGSPIQYWEILINKAGDLHRPSNHRSIYQCMLRTSEPPELSAFDLPDFARPLGQRNVTVLPTQALFLMNSPLLVAQAEQFARRALELPELDPAARMSWIYRKALLREPSTEECQRGLALVADAETELEPQLPDPQERTRRAWATLCQALLVTNEFRYID